MDHLGHNPYQKPYQIWPRMKPCQGWISFAPLRCAPCGWTSWTSAPGLTEDEARHRVGTRQGLRETMEKSQNFNEIHIGSYNHIGVAYFGSENNYITNLLWYVCLPKNGDTLQMADFHRENMAIRSLDLSTGSLQRLRVNGCTMMYPLINVDN